MFTLVLMEKELKREKVLVHKKENMKQQQLGQQILQVQGKFNN
jgi:hypothetical protein